MNFEHDYPPPRKKKGFTMNGLDEQKCVERITDFLKFCKKLKVFLFNLNSCGFVFKFIEESARVLMQITFQAAMQTNIEASPTKRVQQF